MKALLQDVEALKKRFRKQIVFVTTLTSDDKFEDLIGFLDYISANSFTVLLQPVRTNWDVGDFGYFNDIMDKVRKKYGDKILYNKNISKYSHKMIGECVPKLMTFVDSNGNLVYPCEKFVHCKAGSLLEHDMNELWRLGSKKYANFPDKRCGKCGCTGMWEVSLNFRSPFKINFFNF
jgi:MoaA/NifB/PqqE/SkfB family radical SAM enzyme